MRDSEFLGYCFVQETATPVFVTQIHRMEIEPGV